MSLSHIGMKPITDLTVDVANNNPSALAIAKQWGPCRNEVLSDFKYSFCNVIEKMTINPGVDVNDYPEWASFYTYPAAACKVWYIFDSYNVAKKQENQFEVVFNPTLAEKIICCNLDDEDVAYCEYSYNVTDPEQWEPKFMMAFSFRLAAAICFELTGDSTKSKELMQIYISYIHEAKRIAHYEKKSKPEQSNPTVDARG
ncbi:hypothetical protein [Sulfuricurvum sp.]|uniref:hypothetical protein n=1 Tax=Sulfuricurvum sp. TaxID=2025608 RepID=UPI003561A6F1